MRRPGVKTLPAGAASGPRIPMNVLAIYLLGVFLGALDTNVLAPVFPLLEQSFRTSLQWVAWTVTTYTVAYVSSTVLAGALGDRLGHKRLFGYGVGAFAVASLVAALSPSLPIFLLARVIQGAGAGAVYPNAQAEGMRLFPPAKRGLALGVFGAAFGLASIIGPPVGGLIGQTWGWPWVFVMNVPIGVALLLLIRGLPESLRSDRAMPDVAGGLAFSGFLALFLLGIAVPGPWRWAALAGAVILGWTFWMRQRTAATPFMDSRPLVKTSGLALMVGASLIGLDMSAAVFVPTLAHDVLHFSILQSGLSLLPAAFSGAILAGVGGVMTDRRGPRKVLMAGLWAGAGGAALLAWPGLTLVRFMMAMVLLGIGTAFTMGAPLNRIGVALYDDDQAGQALALVAVFRSVGLAAGPVLLTVALGWHGFTGMYGAVALASVVAAGIFFLVPEISPAQMRTRR